MDDGLADTVKPFRAEHDTDAIHFTETKDHYTVMDLMMEKVWFPAKGKVGGGVTFGPYDNQGAWRHSRGPNVGGIKLARFGGRIAHIEFYPWDTFPGITNTIQWYRDNRKIGHEWEPVMSLAGDEEYPCPHNIGVVDMDISTGIEDDQTEPLRLKVLDAILSADMPVFLSTSKRGFHALFRVGEADFGKYRRYPPYHIHGLRMEVFAPSAKKLIATKLHQGIGDALFKNIPYMSQRRIEQIGEIIQ